MADTTVATAAGLNGVPLVNIAENLRVAFDNGRRLSAILREIVTLRRAGGRLAPSEYFYNRLWDPHLSLEEKRGFVGKQAQHRMHVACNDRHWYQTAADKVLFQTIMAGAALPVPHVHPTDIPVVPGLSFSISRSHRETASGTAFLKSSKFVTTANIKWTVPKYPTSAT